MYKKKANEYGRAPLYNIGDRVRVWPVHKNPVGSIESITDPESFPIKYQVKYQYDGGDVYTEEYGEDDLTLVERWQTWDCNCLTESGYHAIWCSRHTRSGR